MQGIGEVRELAKVAPPRTVLSRPPGRRASFIAWGVCSTCADADGSWSPTVLEEQVRRAVQERRRSRREKKLGLSISSGAMTTPAEQPKCR
jgi:hypothetical protein